MKPGDTATVHLPGHRLHGKRVTIERVEPAFNLAHPDCPDRLKCEMIFYTHPSILGAWGISRSNLR